MNTARHLVARTTGRSVLALALLVLAGCASNPGPDPRQQLAERLAGEGRLLPMSSTSGQLPLAGWSRGEQPGAPLVVYIEGDGRAWVSRSTPSPDPTPDNPVALQLAAIDPSPNVLYLARPGQYRGGDVSRDYWLGKRFAPEVVDTYMAVVEREAWVIDAPAIHLVGFSGGGAVAALVAARLQAKGGKPVTLRTVAGNLAVGAWTRSRKLSPLSGSLDPADEAAAMARVPQRHLVGRQDGQVPMGLLNQFLSGMPDRRCVEVSVQDLPHGGPWEQAWRAVGLALPACQP